MRRTYTTGGAVGKREKPSCRTRSGIRLLLSDREEKVTPDQIRVTVKSGHTRSITMAMPWPTPMHIVQSA